MLELCQPQKIKQFHRTHNIGFTQQYPEMRSGSLDVANLANEQQVNEVGEQ